MQTLDLNLSSRPFRNNTLLWVGYVVAAVALSVFSVWNVISWRTHVHRLDELQGRVSGIEAKMAELDQRERAAQRGIDRFDLDALAVQTAKANQVIEWKAFSWTRLFNRMEKIQPNDVRMTSVRPVFRAARRLDQLGVGDPGDTTNVPVAVEGLAKSFQAIRDLQQALMADVHFGRVLPERVNKTPQNEWVFQLTFLYDPNVADSDAETQTEVGTEETSAEVAAGEAAPGEDAGAAAGTETIAAAGDEAGADATGDEAGADATGDDTGEATPDAVPGALAAQAPEPTDFAAPAEVAPEVAPEGGAAAPAGAEPPAQKKLQVGPGEPLRQRHPRNRGPRSKRKAPTGGGS